MSETNRAMYEEAASRRFQHGILYSEVPVKILDDRNRLSTWAKISIDIAKKAIKKRWLQNPIQSILLHIIEVSWVEKILGVSVRAKPSR